MLPKWFVMFDELQSNVRLPPQLQQTCLRAVTRTGEPSKPNLVPKIQFDPKKVDNMRTVRSILSESANVARAATSSIIPTDHLHLSSFTINEIKSEDIGSALSNIPSSNATLQSSSGSSVCHPVDVVPSTSVSHSNVLILTADQFEQLGLNTSVLPVVMTSNQSQSGSVSVSSLSLMSSCYTPASVNMNQPAAAAVATSSNLIGQAFASAVGISVDQLSGFVDVEPDDSQWSLPPAASSQVTAAAVSMPNEVVCGISHNSVTLQVSEQSAMDSVPNTHSTSCEYSVDSKDIFARCDVDVSVLDITMFNSSLSPCPPSQPCDHHINNDSTLATPQKIEHAHDDEHLTFAGAKIRASAEAQTFPSATSSAVVNDSQYPVSCQYSEVGIAGVSSAVSESLVPVDCTYTVDSGMLMSTVSASNYVSSMDSAPVSSPAHGVALLSSASHHTSAPPGLNDVRLSTMILTSSKPLPAGPRAMSLPSSSLHRIKQIPMHHTRSPSKRVPSNKRPILPRDEQPISSSKPISSFLTKPKPKKTAAKVHAQALPAIAPKAVIVKSYLSPVKSYLSPVKQAAASITAKAKRLQNSPSRGVWYTAPRLKTTESPSCSARPDTRPAVNEPDVWILNDDDDEAASGEGEEQNTDVDSQLEDEFEEDSSAVSAEQIPSLYV